MSDSSKSPNGSKKRPNGHGSISLRPDGRWVARISSTDKDGNRRRKAWYAETEREARMLLEEAHQQRGAGHIDLNRSLPRAAHIYFVQPVGGGPIKIGAAKNVAARVMTIQACSPVTLKVIATIPDKDLSYEKKLHHRFRTCRLHGEWFQPVPTLLNFIESLETNSL